MKTRHKLPAWSGVLLLILGIAAISQCSPGLPGSGATMRLDLARLGEDLARDIAPSSDGSTVTSVNLVLSDSTGRQIAVLDGSQGSATAYLEAGGFYGLEVLATITPGGSNPVPRTWTWSTVFLVPASGSLDLDISITRVSLGTSSLVLLAGTQQPAIPSTVIGSRTPKPGLVWTSSNPAVLSVGADGTLTALAAGTAVISAIPDDHGFGAECTVTVSGSSGITISFADPATPTMSGSGAYDSASGTISASVAQNFAQYLWYVNGVEATGQTSQSLSMYWDDNWVDSSQVVHDYFVSGQNNQVMVMVRDDKGTVDTADDEWYQMEFYVYIDSLNQGEA